MVATPLIGPVPLRVNVTATIQDGPVAKHLNVTWTWGDGTNHTLNKPVSPGKNLTLPEVTHNYTTAGLFQLNLTLADGVDPVVTGSVTIQGTPGLTVTLTSTPLVVTVDRPVTFFANATGGVPPYSYVWTVPQNPGCAAELNAPQNLSCDPKTPGLFGVVVQAYDAVGIVHAASLSFTANPKVTVVGTATSVFQCVNGTGSFETYLNGSATGGTSLYTITWDPGDRHANVTGYDVNNTTVYSVVESYPLLTAINVSLNVTDASGYSAFRNFTIETEYGSCGSTASKGIGFSDLLIAGIVAVVAVIAILAAVLLRRRPPGNRPPVAPAPPATPAVVAASAPPPNPPPPA